MPIEIKELIIRAFVSDQKQNNNEEEKPKEKKISNNQDALSVVSNMLKQEKER